MNDIELLFTLKPIIYGLIAILISGFSFPIAGVIILQNGLVPLRYTLMHGVILGGILSIVLGIPMLYIVISLNIILVLVMHYLNVSKKLNLSVVSSALMVLTMGIASLLSHVFDVSSKDMLELFWGSPFTITKNSLFMLIILCILLILYIILFFKPVSLLFLDYDIAKSTGVNVELHTFILLLITAIIISVSMKIMGALLIDALVILPVVSVSKSAKSLKNLFVLSSLVGFGLSLISYFVSIILNLPLSGVISVISVVVFLIFNVIHLIKTKISKQKV